MEFYKYKDELSKMTFENFICDQSNEESYKKLYLLSTSFPFSDNRIVLQGPRKSGKSHLITALLNSVHESNPSLKIQRTNGEDFVSHILFEHHSKSLGFTNTSAERYIDKLLSNNVVIIEDINYVDKQLAEECLTKKMFCELLDKWDFKNKLLVFTIDESYEGRITDDDVLDRLAAFEKLFIGKQNKQSVHMLFASWGFDSPLMRTKFSRIIPQNDSLFEKTCFILPYAGFDFEATYKQEKEYLVEFGFDPDKINMVDCNFNSTSKAPDYIYVPGGDPFKLLKTLIDMDMLDVIKKCIFEKGTVYIGISAGAYLASKSIDYVTQLEDNNIITNNIFDSLGLIKECLICHYEHYSYTTLKICEEIIGTVSMAIRDDQLLMWENEKWSYIE
ncbi:MAG: Type 1 glutamine amidotransferase-like domain-containing protein [Clostridia bacterium]|nr:Type 1 glutamine amidotransferase-like domain-containing protein [Clostridia bacterium]